MDREVDKTRERIGFGKLDDDQRKKLFKTFVDHGGKVADTKKRIATTAKRKPQVIPKKIKETPEPQKIQGKEAFKPKRPSIPVAPKASEEVIKKEAKKAKIFDLVKIYIKGQVLKVFTLSGNQFKDTFMNSLKKQTEECFKDLDNSISKMLKDESSIKGEILLLSEGQEKTFYEFIVRMKAFYNENEFIEILRVVSEKRIPDISHKELFKKFFKRIYILGQYPNTCKKYLFKAVDIQDKYKKIQRDIVPKMKKRLKKAIDIILVDSLMKLHIILCKMEKSYYPLYSQMLDDFLEITEKDKIGYITQMEKKRKIEESKKGRERLATSLEKEKEEIKVPKHIERGFPIINKAVEKFEKVHANDEHSPIALIENIDKMYRTFILLDTFDREYSFILTGGKITFNIEYMEQEKVDIKEDLSHAYLLFTEAQGEVRDYLETVKEIRKTENDIRLTSYQKSAAIEKLSEKSTDLSNKSRRKTAEVMKTIESILQTVIKDYNGDRILVQNYDKVLSFDKNIDGEKILDGKRTIEAIIETFLFSSTFAFILKFGELSGSGIFIEPTDK